MSEAGLVTSKPDQRVRRVFDCVLYNGEIDVLAIRLNELDQAVDCFVIVESTLAFDGSPRTISLNPRDPRISRFAAKLRHVIVADMPETDDATAREAWQRNATLRGVPDVEALDLMILSNVGEIPRRAAVSEMLKDDSNQSFGFCLSLYYLHLNYYRVSGPQTELASCIAATRQHLDMIAPDKLRLAIQNGDEGARIFQKAGWHYSGIVADTKDRPKDVHGRIPDRPGGVWEIQKRPELPNWVTRNRLALSHLFYPFGTRTRFNQFIRRFANTAPKPPKSRRPIVICPYLHDHEGADVRAKFGADLKSNRDIDLFTWQDVDRIGPEMSFEYCWSLFPDRDIILVHTDMAPMPGESSRLWYDQLCDFRDKLPRAGIIGCNLYYPRANETEPLIVQSGGGLFLDGTVDYIHGSIEASTDNLIKPTHDMLRQVRQVDWATFGGVLIRRDVINACGRFDRRYQWAYIMDVDYCLEARLRGYTVVQVPVSLTHEESRTTKQEMERDPALRDKADTNHKLLIAKWQKYAGVLPSNFSHPLELATLR